MRPFVSVVVPCRNESAFIDRCLDSIFASDYPADRMEVIVADGMSDDTTRVLLIRRAAREERLSVVDNPERVTPSALNRGIAAAKGEIVVRFDAHASMARDYIRRCVELLESSGADNVGGTIRTVPQAPGWFAEAAVTALGHPFGVGNSAFRTLSGESELRPADTVFGGCWRRENLCRSGGFNEKLIRGQDLEFNLRMCAAGGRILLDPSIVSDYYARTGLVEFCRHNFQNGVWAVLPFGLSDVVPVRARHLIPLAFVMALFVSIALGSPWIAIAYAAANGLSSANAAIGKRRCDLLALMPVAFASLHMAYGLGSAWGCLKLGARKK